MDYSYNSEWNDFVKIECEKLKKKGHVFDAEGTHMKLISIKYQKKLAREEAKKNRTTSIPSSHPQKLTGSLAKADEAYYIHMRQKAEAEDYAKKECSQVKQTAAKVKAELKELGKANTAAYNAYMREAKKEQEELERVRIASESKRQQEQLAREAKQQDEMLKIRAKQQEELERVKKEAKRIRDLETAKKEFSLMDKSKKNLKDFKDGKIDGVLV